MIKARFLRRSALETLREMVPQNLDAYRAGNFDHLLIDHDLYFEVQFSIDTDRLATLSADVSGDWRFLTRSKSFFIGPMCVHRLLNAPPYLKTSIFSVRSSDGFRSPTQATNACSSGLPSGD